MIEQEALKRMIAPGMRRQGVPQGGVLQIWVTRACDKACFNCTQGSNLRGHTPPITLEQFEEACASLVGYFGTVGMFGGNPVLHPQFEALCDILCKYIPYKQRGLWCNKLFGKGPIARRTFNPSVSNLNVHLDKEADAEFRRDWPECAPFGLHNESNHSPPHVAMMDVDKLPFKGEKEPRDNTEENRWELIADCDINQRWSAMIAPFRGQLRGYFCEIAGAQAILHQNNPDYPDTGVPITQGWWRQGMEAFANQARYHCHRCGVPMRGVGELSQGKDGAGREQTSNTHKDIYLPKVKDRQVEVVETLTQLQPQAFKRMTNYLQNAK